MGRRLRRPGTPWRIKVHEYRPAGKRGERGTYGPAHNIADHTWDVEDTEWSRYVQLPGTEFDEIAVGAWLHVEQKDTDRWWINIGGVTVWVRVDRDGRAKHVDVYGPGDWGAAQPGVTYTSTWTHEPEESDK